MAKTNRKAITQGISYLLESRFEKNGIKWASEVALHPPQMEKPVRVDYMTYTYPTGWVGHYASAEQGLVGIYEVKSCMADYKSGNGLGFVGDHNVLVCPSTLAEELRGSHALFRKQVLCPLPIGRSVSAEMNDPQPYSGEVDGWSLRIYYKSGAECRRTIPVAYALAQMVYAYYAHGDMKRLRTPKPENC